MCVWSRIWIVSVAIGADMRKRNIAFMTAVLGVASVFTLISLSFAVRLIPTVSDNHETTAGAAGEARDVDMDLLQQLLRANQLSDREAEFYK